jgi:hypothetical protein
MQRISFLTSIFLFILTFAGCKASIAQLPPGEIIARSSERMNSLKGFEFLVERSGAPAYLDLDKTVTFRRAEGRFTAPDRVHATVRVIAPALVTDVQVMSIGGGLWATNLFSGAWQVSDPRYEFNPSRLFDREIGIQAVLEQDLIDVTLRGLEELPEIPGKTFYALEATLQGDGAYEMTYGLIDKDTMHVQIWIAPEQFDIYRVILVDPADPGEEEDTTWQIDFWSFDERFDIQPPIIPPPG